MRALTTPEAARLQALRRVWPMARLFVLRSDERPGPPIYALLAADHRSRRSHGGEGALRWRSERALFVDLDSGLTFDRPGPEFKSRFDPIPG